MVNLYDFQSKVDNCLRQNRSVILQAPTGAGKTRAALFTFLDSWRNRDAALFPRQCIYVVPMRVLANQFEAEYKETIRRYIQSHGLREVGTVSVQTGARPNDRTFDSDLIFTTVDQVLSSFLTIPYSLSNRQANLNAGAIVGSYLVFDEFHLFPVDKNGHGALATTLQILKLLKGVVPFVLMTATFSNTMLQQLCKELDAEEVTLTPDEVSEIPSQKNKVRRYCYLNKEMTTDRVIEDFVQQQRKRVIIVCNTVQRAQDVAEALRDDPRSEGIHVELLHSRFYGSDRDSKENDIRCEFGEDKAQYSWGPTILVATQVIEVGLNITCETLHTELAPAAAIVQRAGRCARFANEEGLVCIYDVPQNDASEPNYAPYHDDGQREVCERTRAALDELSEVGRVYTYHDELALVNAAHHHVDGRLIEVLRTNEANLRAELKQIFETQDRSATREHIRDIDNRTVIVHHNPNEQTVPNPYRYEGIGIRRKALLKWYTNVQESAMEQELDWTIKIAISQEATSTNEGAEQRRGIEIQWQTHRPSTHKEDIRAACSDIVGSGLIVVNPVLVTYDRDLGFRFAIGTPAPDSPLSPARAKDKDFGPIHRETYAEHITGLYRAYINQLRDRTAAARHRLEQHLQLAPNTLDRAIRLMFAVHDLGKLDRVWQEWAHSWQEQVSKLRYLDRTIPATYMAAHTDYDSMDASERQAQFHIHPKRPNHAAESTQAGKHLIDALAGNCDALYVAMATAIICHHSAHFRHDHGAWHPDPAAKDAFNEAMRCVGLGNDAELLDALKASGKKINWQVGFGAAEGLSEELIDITETNELVLYLFLVRILRLADQKSQEL